MALALALTLIPPHDKRQLGMPEPWSYELAAQHFSQGNLDVQGFEILAGLRVHFPAVQSLLMGAETLAAFQAFVVAGVSTAVDEPKRLTTAELALYQQLKAQNWRLEQERIPQSYVVQVVRDNWG